MNGWMDLYLHSLRIGLLCLVFGALGFAACIHSCIVRRVNIAFALLLYVYRSFLTGGYTYLKTK